MSRKIIKNFTFKQVADILAIHVLNKEKIPGSALCIERIMEVDLRRKDGATSLERFRLEIELE